MAEPTLRRGSSGEVVRQLQVALHGLGYDVGAVDGEFGAKTEAAVRTFQGDKEIDVDGVVGPITWLNIDEADQHEPVLRRGSTGNPVRRAQKRITLSGGDVGGVDGIFGARTESGVRTFQSEQHIGADGIVGAQTWAKIDALGD